MNIGQSKIIEHVIQIMTYESESNELIAENIRKRDGICCCDINALMTEECQCGAI